MPHLAFEMTSRDHESRRLEFRGKNKADYYDGDLQPLASRDIDLRIDKSAAGNHSIYRLRSTTPMSFRRSSAHIRHDKTSVTVLWFVRRGEITVSSPGSRYVIHPREVAITRSNRAFYMELTGDDDGDIEVMHLVVPNHKLHAVISEHLEIGRPFSTSQGVFALAERVFSMLFEEGERIDPIIAEQVVDTLLAGIGKTIADLTGQPAPRGSIAERRVADVSRYIHQHFANPDLNAKMAADSCGISLRYLCHVLKGQELSFSGLVWDRRMEAAHDWLRDEGMRNYSICEIAYLSGFKSSAHFTRMFKARHGVAPREFRAAAPAEARRAA